MRAGPRSSPVQSRSGPLHPLPTRSALFGYSERLIRCFSVAWRSYLYLSTGGFPNFLAINYLVPNALTVLPALPALIALKVLTCLLLCTT